MVKTILTSTQVKVPADVKVTASSRKVTVTGPRGTLTREFKPLPVDIQAVGKKAVKIEVWMGNRAHVASVKTVSTHIKNMILGVTKVLPF